MNFMVVLLSLAIVLCMPLGSLAERASSKNLDREIFVHVTLPCVMSTIMIELKRSLLEKKDFSAPRLESAALDIVQLYLKSNFRERGIEFKQYLMAMDLPNMNRHQRMVAYQLALTGYISGALTGKSDHETVRAFLEDDYIAKLSAIGWEFDPYKP